MARITSSGGPGGVGRPCSVILMIMSGRGISSLLGFTAQGFSENMPMLRLFEQTGFEIEQTVDAGAYELRMSFRES